MLTRRFFAILTVALSCSAVQAQFSTPFPARPVKLVVPYAPGGPTDNVARLFAQKLQDRWRQPVVVENKPGASGALGAEQVTKSPADGHTLMVTITSMLQAPLLDKQLRYDLERDFAPLAQVASSALVLVTGTAMGVTSLPAFMSALKAAPQKYSYGSIGVGSSLHLYGDQLARRWGVQPTHVAFKGASPLVVELLADRVEFAFLDFLSVRQHIEAGKLRALAVTGAHRSAIFPAVPTLEEAGVPGFEVTSWVGLFAPKATPSAVLHKISSDVAEVTKLPEVVARLKDAGMEVKATSPEEFGRHLAADRQIWHRLIIESKATPQ